MGESTETNKLVVTRIEPERDGEPTQHTYEVPFRDD